MARAAIAAGAEIVNDIGALRLDRELPKVVASERVAIVLMHSRGKPQQMHHLPRVRNIVKAVSESLERSVKKSSFCRYLEQADHCRSGYRLQQDARRQSSAAQTTGYSEPPWTSNLGGSFAEILSRQGSECSGGARLIGSLACCAMAIMEGAHIVRVHDVKETRKWLYCVTP